MMAPTGYIVPAFVELAGILAEDRQSPAWPTTPTSTRSSSSCPFDPNSEYYIPKDWGTTGFMYRSSDVTETPLGRGPTSSPWLRKYSGKIGIIDDQAGRHRDGTQVAGLSASIRSTRPSSTRRPRSSTHWRPISATCPAITGQVLRDKDMLIHSGWNGDAATLKADAQYADTVYIVPTEGTEFWLDAWVIPAEAPHPNAAYAWLDYLMRPEIAAQETAYTHYGCAFSGGL